MIHSISLENKLSIELPWSPEMALHGILIFVIGEARDGIKRL